MFFIASKLLWIVVAPVNLALISGLIGMFMLGRFPRLGRALAAFSLIFLLFVGVAPVGMTMLRPLESRFPPPPPAAAAPYGIIVLGGAMDDDVGAVRGQVILTDGGSRLTEGALLAKRYPQAKLVYTGGSPSVTNPESEEAAQARGLFLGLGIPAERIIIETRSRNTDENARFSADILKPQMGQTWWLVTSAFHTPRSMGLFRKAGFDVVAYPTDFRTTGQARDFKLTSDPVDGLKLFNLATHEWIGLVAYYLAGKTNDPFPAP